jgi:arylsulfatase A-like enzyme
MYAAADVPGFRRAASVVEEAAVHPLMDLALRQTDVAHFAPGMSGPVAELSDAEFRQIKATYYGMIAEVDDELGRVFSALKAAGVWETTLVVFTSDHAELLGDHHTLGKGGFHDQSQHVPLVIHDPRSVVRGRVVEAFTEAVDLYPTLLEAVGAEPAHIGDGSSLAPWLAGDTPARWRDAAHWEFDFREVATQATERALGLSSTELNMAAIRTQRFKYVHFAALPPLLFDLELDPDNLHNVVDDPAYAGARIEMAERLLSWRAQHLDQTLALKELTPAGVVSVPSVR